MKKFEYTYEGVPSFEGSGEQTTTIYFKNVSDQFGARTKKAAKGWHPSCPRRGNAVFIYTL